MGPLSCSRRRFLYTSAAILTTCRTTLAAGPIKFFRLFVVVRAGQGDDVLANGKLRTWQAWRAELRHLGYVERQNLSISVRAVRPGQVTGLANEIASIKPDAIFVPAQNIITRLQAFDVKSPIVTIAINPVGAGLAASLARPGGNITGLSLDAGLQTIAKRIELLKRAAPSVTRLAVLILKPYWNGLYDEIFASTARQFGISAIGAPFEAPADEAEYRRAFATLSAAGADSLYVTPAPENFRQRGLIGELALASRLPSVGFYPENAQAGCLIAYGPDLVDIFRRAAGYLDRILRGANPADMPIEQPTKFDLVINLKTAKALGLAFSSDLLALASDVIE